MAQDADLVHSEELMGGRTFEDVIAAGLLDLDLAVPESPAFTAIDVNPEQITRPGNPREFATALLSGLDRNGNFQAGLALDTVPYLVIDGRNLSLAQYRESPDGFNWRRQLARAQLSLATTKGTNEDDESVRAGLGLRFSPWSRGDPRMDDALVSCLARAAWIPSPEGIEESSDEDFEEQPTEADAAREEGIQAYARTLDEWEPLAVAKAETCLEPAEARLQKASAWDIGVAPTWIQRDGSDSSTQWGGGTVWSSFAWNFAEDAASAATPSADSFRSYEEWKGWMPAPLEPAPSRAPQLITHVRFAFDQTVADTRNETGFVDQDSLFAGARLRWGRSNLLVSIDAAYLLEDPDDASADHSFRAGLAADIQLVEQVWAQLAIGSSFGREEDRIQIGASLKWGGRSMDLSQIVGLVRDTAPDAATGVSAPSNSP